MKITTKLLGALVIAAASFGARAADSYLYWMADNTIKNQLTGEAVDYTYVRVNFGGTVADADFNSGKVTGGTWLTPYYGGAAIGTADAGMDAEGVKNGGTYWGVFDYNSSSTFLFELFNEEDDVVGWLSTPIGIDFIATSSSQTGSTASAYTLSQVVPEPTSGLLMLFGLAGLALRRKRALA